MVGFDAHLVLRPSFRTCFTGKFTVLDQYTFKWPDGRMALALGLGIEIYLSDCSITSG
jgi:hypothetical protein